MINENSMNNTANSPIIELKNVSKRYYTYATPHHRLLEILSRGKKSYAHETRALDDISFSLERGGRLGIVGENGSGKSTLLKVLAGVLTPTSGSVQVNGRVSALLELGAGFNPELPGRENIRQFCMLHGMHKDEIERALPDIVKFSELKEAIDHPVKTYSSGMAVRLGFACAVYVEPDILIVDEALSVGDAYFQNKCLHKIRTMLDNGTSFIYVTHAADSIRALCNEGLWLNKGKVQLYGSASDVGTAYQSEIFSRLVRAGLGEDSNTEVSPSEPVSDISKADTILDSARVSAFAQRVEAMRTGSGEIRIDDICVINAEGVDTDSIGIDEHVTIRVFYRIKSPPPPKSVLNVGITDSSGRQILHFNPMYSDIYASDAPPHVPQVMEFTFKSPLCPGEYGVQAGIGTLDNNPTNHGQSLVESVIDFCPGATRFNVRFPDKSIGRDLWGIVHVDYKVSLRSID